MKKSRISEYEADFIRGYLSRRWDLFNVLGSGIFSYIFGLFFGAWSDFLIFKDTNIGLIVLNYYYIINVFSVFILFLMIFSLNWINRDRHGMIKAVLNNMTIYVEDLKKPFKNLEFEIIN